MDYEPRIDESDLPDIPLPAGWPDFALAALLHAISLARLAIMSARNWPDGPECDTLRLRAENDRLRSEVALLKQELEIKDDRLASIDPRRRPKFTSKQRLAILLLKTTRGWNNVQVAKKFQVTVQTIRTWIRAVKENGGTLLHWDEKPTRYPDYLREVIRHLKTYCPLLGRNMIADILARTGLHISASTVRRIINEEPIEPSDEELPYDDLDDEPNDRKPSEPHREIIAKHSTEFGSLISRRFRSTKA